MTREEIIAWTDNNGYLSPKNAVAYYDVLVTMPVTGSLLEIGTGRGDSATFFAMVKPGWIIYTVDSYACASDYVGAYMIEELRELADGWKRNGYHNILPIVANSFTMPWEIPVDVLYLDGDHKYEAIKSDFEKFSLFVKPGGMIFMDDYGIHDHGQIEVDTYVNTELQEYRKSPVLGGSGLIIWQK